MKLIDKLKNVFFEEVPDDEDEEELPQTFAKKIEVPKKHVEPVRIKEEPKPAVIEKKDIHKPEPIKEIIPPLEEKKEEKEENTFPMMFDDDDFLEDKKMKEMDDTFSHPTPVKREENRELYHGKKELSYIESVRKPSYTYTKSYYEERQTKEFRPSPIISPVYGILDKNYKKEDVVPKKEVRLTSAYSKEKLDLDDVRNRAFGSVEDASKITSTETHTYSFEVEKKEPETEAPENILVDLSDNTKKPDVKDLTMGDALEYFHDLGLEYNVDYVDATKKNEITKQEVPVPSTEAKQVSSEPEVSITPIVSHEVESTPVTEAPTTAPATEVDLDDTIADDNLFDLIDSMYKDSES